MNKKATQVGVEYIAIGVGTNVDPEELQVVAGSDRQHIFQVDSFDDLKKYSPEIAMQICQGIVFFLLSDHFRKLRYKSLFLLYINMKIGKIDVNCTTFHRYPIFSKRYSVLCKVYTGYCGTSEIEHGLCACTVDNPLAKARGLSLRTGAQTMLYLPHVRLADEHLYWKKLFTWLSLVMSLMASFWAVLFPTRCLG